MRASPVAAPFSLEDRRLDERVRQIGEALAAHGLIARGALDFGPGDDAPPGPAGIHAGAVLLVGQAGDAPWPHFARWRARQPAGLRDPLDAWAREIIEAVAARFAGRAVFPSDRPYLPFQSWAMRAEGLRPSPLGILMHPAYGLWHAYRGALLFDEPLEAPTPAPVAHLCDGCMDKPCLSACPVGAHSLSGFAHGDCLAYVRSGAGVVCGNGCLDRNACPHAAYRYRAEAQAFHMTAFAQ